MDTQSKRYSANLACLNRRNELIETFCKTPQKQADINKYRKQMDENDIEWGKALMMKDKS